MQELETLAPRLVSILGRSPLEYERGKQPEDWQPLKKEDMVHVSQKPDKVILRSERRSWKNPRNQHNLLGGGRNKWKG